MVEFVAAVIALSLVLISRILSTIAGNAAMCQFISRISSRISGTAFYDLYFRFLRNGKYFPDSGRYPCAVQESVLVPKKIFRWILKYLVFLRFVIATHPAATEFYSE